MTTFKEQLVIDEPVFFNTDEFAEAATYKGAEIKVVEAEVSEQSSGSPGFVVPLFSVYLSARDVARPKAGDAVVFRGVTCKVSAYPVSAGGVWKVDLIKETVQV